MKGTHSIQSYFAADKCATESQIYADVPTSEHGETKGDKTKINTSVATPHNNTMKGDSQNHRASFPVHGLTKGDKTKTNVSAAPLHNNTMKRMLILEAKRFPKPQGKLSNDCGDAEDTWKPHLEQLQGYMEKYGAPGNMTCFMVQVKNRKHDRLT
jgi:hypothetical protein